MSIFTPLQGIALLAGYTLFITLLYLGLRVRKGTLWTPFSKLEFLVANREVGRTTGGLSVAESWVWATGLVLSAEKAYTQGWVGSFWFMFGNTLCLILFAFFAHKLRQKYPAGFTGSGYMRDRHSGRVQSLYVTTFGGLAICSFALQLLVGGKIISTLFGLPYALVVVVLACIPVGYSLFGGFRTTVRNDAIQMIVMLLLIMTLIPWTIYNAGVSQNMNGWDIVYKGVGGVSGTFNSLFSPEGLTVFYTFGLAATIGLMSGPFGDQSFWQRANAIRKDDVRSAFLMAPFIWCIVPLGMIALGFLAAGLNYTWSPGGSPINLEMVVKYLPAWGVLFFALLLLSGLVSKLDTNLSAMASLAGHDVAQKTGRETDADAVLFSRIAMVILVLGGIAIAYAEPRLEHLFLIYGTLRSATLLPTLISVYKERVSEAGMFWGILVSLTLGFPMFAYGVVNKILWVSISGTLVTLLASGSIVLFTSAMETRKVKAAQ